MLADCTQIRKTYLLLANIYINGQDYFVELVLIHLLSIAKYISCLQLPSLKISFSSYLVSLAHIFLSLIVEVLMWSHQIVLVL